MFTNYNFSQLGLDSSKKYHRMFFSQADMMRGDFARDRDRIIHSDCFRALQGKTQVFVPFLYNFCRNRLTHSLEVAQVARTLADIFCINRDLCEGIALAHDIGHSPLGHRGEKILDSCMHGYGLSYDHNIQVIRFLTLLESPYEDFLGLNLTYEFLDGIIKHNGPSVVKKHNSLIVDIYDKWGADRLHTQGSIEAQVAAISDDISYISHDIHDGLRNDLFSIEDVCEESGIVSRVCSEDRNVLLSSKKGFIKKLVSNIIKVLVTDVINETKRRKEFYDITSFNDVLNCDISIVSFSHTVQKELNLTRSFLFKNMYHHASILRDLEENAFAMKYVFNNLMKDGELFFDRIAEDLLRRREWSSHSIDRSMFVVDWIASMTDFFLWKKYKEIKG